MTTYASIGDIATSWDHYGRCLAQLAESMPDGLVLYLAGPTEEGVRVIAVWDSERASDRFRQDRFEPAIAAMQRPSGPQWTVRDLRVAHVVLGTDRPAAQPSKEEPSC